MGKKAFDIKNLGGQVTAISRFAARKTLVKQRLEGQLRLTPARFWRLPEVLGNRQSNQCTIRNFDACWISGGHSGVIGGG
jgi:hypothetical protein